MSRSHPSNMLVSSRVPSDTNLFGARGLSLLIGSVVAKWQQTLCMASGIMAVRREMLFGRSSPIEVVLSM